MAARSGVGSSGAIVATPTQAGVWLAGSFFDFFRDPIATFTRAADLHGDVVRFRVFHETMYFFRHPDAVKYILKDSYELYSREQNLEVACFRALLGEGVLTVDGERWIRYRRAAQPAFGRQALAVAARRVVDTTAEMLATWRPTTEDAPFDAFCELNVLATGAIVRALFGLYADVATARRVAAALSDGQRFIYDTMGLPFALPRVIPTPGNRRFTRAARALADVVRRAIASRRVDGEGDGEGDLLDVLLCTGDLADPGDVGVIGQLLNIFVAGPENAGNTLSWALYLLARHPDVEARLRAELEAELAGRPLMVQDLPRLRYCSAVISEVLRLFPGTWAFDRRCVADDVVCGHAVPRGAIVFVSPFVTHRTAAFWPEPERFLPERFLESSDKCNLDAYFPFGLGPRQCIGSRFARTLLESMLAMILTRFRVRLAVSGPVRPLPLVTLRPAGGMPIFIERL